MATIIVKYWRGTTQLEGKARSYEGAMRIASRNQNAYGPTFWTPEGKQLVELGDYLVEACEGDKPAGEPVVAYACRRN